MAPLAAQQIKSIQYMHSRLTMGGMQRSFGYNMPNAHEMSSGRAQPGLLASVRLLTVKGQSHSL